MLHEDVQNYVHFYKKDKDKLISKYSLLNENYKECELQNVSVSEKDIEPALKSLSDGLLTSIKDITYLEKKYNLKIKNEKNKAYSAGLEVTLEVTRELLNRGCLEEITLARLDMWFAVFFKRTKLPTPSNPPYFVQIQQINDAYEHALDLMAQKSVKLVY